MQCVVTVPFNLEQFPILSYTDFYQLAGVTAIEVTSGSEIPFHPRREFSSASLMLWIFGTEKSKIKQNSQALARPTVQVSTLMLESRKISMETHSLARPSRTIWHAHATNSSLYVPLSMACAETSLELRLRHALTMLNSTLVLSIKFYFGLKNTSQSLLLAWAHIR
ncbi:hypothetical protein JCGZ_18121 [Jatropha curcas]|uniref:Uncharacterized protein n=1 Tax=Jatropha curcas TaxID=180498 RepID=A0A067K1N3_JATCU|nr:hypothetical protein JCGZ_18121 [Jatropha curcas]